MAADALQTHTLTYERVKGKVVSQSQLSFDQIVDQIVSDSRASRLKTSPSRWPPPFSFVYWKIKSERGGGGGEVDGGKKGRVRS